MMTQTETFELLEFLADIVDGLQHDSHEIKDALNEVEERFKELNGRISRFKALLKQMREK